MNVNCMKLIFFLSLILVILPVMAQIYEYTDVYGNKVFSDCAPIHFNTKPVNLPRKLQDSHTPSHLPLTSFPSLVINSPKDQQTFWNARQIPVRISGLPQLPAGYSLNLLIDGIAHDQPATRSEFVMENLPRGTHTIQAQILAPHRITVKSSPAIIIYVHRW